ncbi:hypothetical protein HPC49_49910 [Pyxidicoccus fallax]|uniref:Lipoprotein n=1 Tax=Pyxidicoccus fallax TaxID=394095 RepID=A0A848M1T4_9BACT|nr:hypothetical protein [Pyxidicoccus fallax]NMO23314.1 hypothetical protein [Pyxidicoccus fallax]NPC86290.1 hypothetical protein [Pyxidicoccus fallax]
MKHALPAFLLLLPACALFQRPPRPVHAPAAETAGVEFPLALPLDGRQVVGGTMLKAIQLAMDDYLPWDRKLPSGATPLQECLSRRESYDVAAAPGSEAIMYVSIIPNAEACDIGGPPILDVGANYVIDTRGWRILRVQQ